MDREVVMLLAMQKAGRRHLANRTLTIDSDMLHARHDGVAPNNCRQIASCNISAKPGKAPLEMVH